MRLKVLLPLFIFFVLAGFLFRGLYLKPREVPSPLIGKPVPSFRLSTLDAPSTVLTEKDFAGKVWLLNVWASWCVTCKVEHPLLVAAAKRGEANFVGLNYKDKNNLAHKWLTELGNPYSVSLVDADGRTGLDLGVYGVPETFVIDKRGVIRHKHIGAIEAGAWTQTILPLVNQLAREP